MLAAALCASLCCLTASACCMAALRSPSSCSAASCTAAETLATAAALLEAALHGFRVGLGCVPALETPGLLWSLLPRVSLCVSRDARLSVAREGLDWGAYTHTHTHTHIHTCQASCLRSTSMHVFVHTGNAPIKHEDMGACACVCVCVYVCAAPNPTCVPAACAKSVMSEAVERADTDCHSGLACNVYICTHADMHAEMQCRGKQDTHTHARARAHAHMRADTYTPNHTVFAEVRA